MPFLQSLLFSETINREKIVTLQVRSLPYHRNFSGKRVSHGISLRKKVRASLTVEAACALSLFIFAMVSLMMPMKMMDTHRRIQAVTESIAEELTQYAYVTYQIGHGGLPKVPVLGSMAGEFGETLTDTAVKAYAFVKISAAVDSREADQILTVNSKILEDQETIDLVVDYRLKLPFPVFQLEGVRQTVRSRRRAWIGREGKIGTSQDGETEKDEIVYIGKNPTRYHRERTCHYLYNNLQTVARNQVGTYRNADGGIYKPCSVCGQAAGAGSQVYIMPSGDAYHSRKDCSAIIAYVQAVRLSEVEYLGGCSYCSK